MIVENVSPTPFSLLRRAKNFEYRDDDWHLQEFANYDDPINALTDECLRVLKCISSANASSVSSTKQSTSLRDASWSRFEDIGFGGSIESDEEEKKEALPPVSRKSGSAGGLSNVPNSQAGDLGRPTTPSWADFMSSGFADENSVKSPVSPLLLPPDKVLPPIATARGQSSQSHKRTLDEDPALEAAELASINTLEMDDSFWWVWISSLSGDEPSARKAVFGRCALLETVIRGTKWLVLEEQVKGAAPEPDSGAQIVEKKRFFSLGSFGSRRTRLGRRKSSAKKVSSIEDAYQRPNNQGPQSKTSIGPDQHKRIQAAAAALQKKHREHEAEANTNRADPKAERDSKTQSVMTLQPAIVNEASQALEWTKNYDEGAMNPVATDKVAMREMYLRNRDAGTGAAEQAIETTEPKSQETEEKPSTPSVLSVSTTKDAPVPPPKESPATAAAGPPSPAPAQSPKNTFETRSPEEEKANTKGVFFEQIIEPRESVDEPKKNKKKTGTSTFKNILNGMRKPEQQQQPPAIQNTGAKDTSTVAATRAALEARQKAAQQQSTPVKKKPLPKEAAVAIEPVTIESELPSTPKQPEQRAEPVVGPPTPTQPTSPRQENGGPPKTRRALESDALSRIDTTERDAADQEFSKFDQGPLVDQPAFVPDSPTSPEPEKTEFPQTPTNGNGVKSEDTAGSPESTAPAQDRWKAIREAAAERMAAKEKREADWEVVGINGIDHEVNTEPETESTTQASQSGRTDEDFTNEEEGKSIFPNSI